MDSDNVAVVASWPTPCSARGLRSFLDPAGYYHKFIRDYGMITALLTWLLRKNSYTWSEEADAAFQALKRALSTGPGLQMPRFDSLFVVDCDASSC
jgi:hypothetical protein